MTEDANRNQANLLILCKFHSTVIDENADAYPAESLRNWKAQAERVGHGEVISESEAAEISKASFSQETYLQAETINVGGDNGGGGGAIGFGAFGGDGNVYVLGSEPNQVVPRITLPETVGVSEQKDYRAAGRSEPREASVELPGLDVQPPSMTSISTEASGVLTAIGGSGGRKAGSGSRTASPNLRVVCMFAAHAIEIHDALFSVLGAGWTSYSCAEFPTIFAIPVGLMIDVGGVAEGEYGIYVEMRDSANDLCARESFPIVVLRRGDFSVLNLQVFLRGTFATAGLHRLMVSSDDGVLTSSTLNVTHQS